jgi:hypothetical protein
MPNFLDVIGGIIKPITNLVDSLHTSEEERLKVKAELLTLQTTLLSNVLNYETKLAEAQSKVIVAEAQGQSWLQRNWRPVLMLSFTAIVVNNYILAPIFGTPPATVPESMWTLMQIGVGGYIVGRSAEKVVPGVVDALKSREK